MSYIVQRGNAKVLQEIGREIQGRRIEKGKVA